MNLATLFSLLAFLAAAAAVWAALRGKPGEGRQLEALQRHLDVEINQQRRDIQSDVSTQLLPLQRAFTELQQALAELSKDAAVGREAALSLQAKQLSERFEALNSGLQNALK